MTGFGAAVLESDSLQIQVEVRSVNHRYQKISSTINGPEFGPSLGYLSHRIEEFVKGRTDRGSVNLSVSLRRHTSNAALDHNRLLTDYRELAAVREDLIEEGYEVPTLALSDVARLRGELSDSASAQPGSLEVIEKKLEQCVEEALENLRAMQTVEGENLRGELRTLLDGVGERLDALELKMPELSRLNLERYRNKLQEFLAGSGVDLDDAVVLREVAVLAEKADISEEFGRLRSHLKQYRENLDLGGRVGRKLDFLTQEMFRETNTMSAKVNRFESAREIVDIKADVDRLREQTQNIE